MAMVGFQEVKHNTVVMALKKIVKGLAPFKYKSKSGVKCVMEREILQAKELLK
jgi:hypothetical protein